MALKFSRFELLVDTNYGSYTVVVPTEEMYGYDTARETKFALSVTEARRLDLLRENLLLKIKCAT